MARCAVYDPLGGIHFHDSDSVVQAVSEGSRPNATARSQRQSAEYQTTDRGAGNTSV